MVADNKGFSLVAPFTGAWIEIVLVAFSYAWLASLPSRERGLKLGKGVIAKEGNKSLPSRERGLKLN